ACATWNQQINGWSVGVDETCSMWLSSMPEDGRRLMAAQQPSLFTVITMPISSTSSPSEDAPGAEQPQ
ncbi:unnamed protein product, partial [Symbiodinium necroappetens]